MLFIYEIKEKYKYGLESYVMEKQIKLFLEFLENDKKLSSNTLQSYKRDITQYQEYIDKNGLNYLKIDNEDIDKYFENLKGMNKKTSTISRNLATIDRKSVV